MSLDNVQHCTQTWTSTFYAMRLLRWLYQDAMRGTGARYALCAARYWATICCYALASRCAVLGYAMLLRTCYAMRGTGRGYLGAWGIVLARINPLALVLARINPPSLTLSRISRRFFLAPCKDHTLSQYRESCSNIRYLSTGYRVAAYAISALRRYRVSRSSICEGGSAQRLVRA
eukprot:3223089-Rhodomonas_salina.1